jgi:hypothetical protein
VARQSETVENFGAFCGRELDAQAAWSDRIHPPVLRQGECPETMKTERGRLEALIAAMKDARRDLKQNPGSSSQAADDYLQRMADVLAYALMCEEGARELAHCQDAEKALFAARFYERAFIANIRPNLNAPLLQKEFARVAEGRGIDPGYFTNSTAAKTTPTTTSDTAPIRT